jgi:hypothetical protein
MVRSTIRRSSIVLITVVAGLAVGVSTAAVASPPANSTVIPSNAAAGWLARQMTNGDHFEVTFGDQTFPDQGLTVDAIFAFAATKTSNEFGARATTWLAQPDILASYIGDGGTESYAGATAKAALAVQVRGLDPTNFGGVDLITRLRALQEPSGRFVDRSLFGDFSNEFGQSLAVLALQRTAAGAPPAAVTFLAATACADGGFPVFFNESPCVSDVDATALAVQALKAAHRPVPAAAGLRWLVSVQNANGGFANSGGTLNANSTGLAAQALFGSVHIVAATRAFAFLRTLQVTCDGAVADRGAIAFDSTGLDPSTAARATAQGILGLAGVGFNQLSAAGSSGPAPTLRCP